jgi:hypothetical protein
MAPFYENYLEWNEKKNKIMFIFFNQEFNLYSISNGILFFSIEKYLIIQK